MASNPRSRIVQQDGRPAILGQTASRSPSASAKLASVPSPIGSTRIIGGWRSTAACAEVARAVAVEAAVISAPKLDQGVMTPTVATEPGWTV
jgi:hypothetical protein